MKSKIFFITLSCVWCLLASLSTWWAVQGEDGSMLNLANAEARAAFNKDLAYRRWATSHGGVYVPVTAQTPPNEYLVHVPHRDITAFEGLQLTLMNPAYMTRQVHELSQGQYGYKGHITSLKPIRPQNAPDPWESRALIAFHGGAKEYRGVEFIGGVEYFRFMLPMIAEKGCLKCHAQQGYSEGDIRGGISVSFPLAPFRAIARGRIRSIVLFHGTIMLLGLVAIWVGFAVHKRRVSERDRSMANLVESEERFRGIFENASVGIAQMDPAGRLMQINQPFCDITGHTLQEMRGLSFQEIAVRDDYQIYQGLLLEALDGARRSFSLEMRLFHEEGSLVWVHMSISLILDSYGQPAYFVLVAKDITARKLAEERLNESEERFRIAFETSPDAVNINRLEDGKYVSINQAFTSIMGYAWEEVRGKTSLELGIWHDLADRKRLSELLKKHGKVANLEAVFRAKDGTLVDGLMSAAVIHLKGEAHIVSITSDIREMKKAQRALADQQQRIEAIMQANPDPVVVYDAEGRTQYLNPAFTRVFGWTFEDVKGRTIPFVPEELQEKARSTTAETWRTGRAQTMECRRFTKDGQLLDVMVSLAGIQDQNEKTVGLVVNLTDISRLKNSEAERLKLATAMEQAAEAVVITDLEGSILYVNPAFERVTGYSREEALGQNPRILQSGKQDEAFYKKLWDGITSGAVWSGTFINRKKDGSFFHEEATISPVRDSDGKIVNFVAVKRDVTKEVQLEKSLRQSQKMESIGTLAGGIAHDFNNILGAITGYAELALDDRRNERELRRDIEQVLIASDRAQQLVQQILTFSREVEPRLKPLNLNRAVRHTASMLERTLPKMINIELKLRPDLAHIQGDFGQLEQVILNLGTNARDAMEGEGSLLMETEHAWLDEEYCRLEEGLQPGRYVLLSVSDTGQGMAKDVLERIFDPFFTTKEPGKGTGLGLAMVFGIVKSHAGHVACHSQPGTGTTFKIYLPALEHSEEALDEPVTTLSQLPTGDETLLVVDDEESVRQMASRILGSQGYKVRHAASGEEAVEIYRREKGAINLVVLDLGMPGMGGHGAMKCLLELDPAVKVIVTSGYARNGTVSRTLDLGAAGFVPKPYKKADLLKLVRRVLDA